MNEIAKSERSSVTELARFRRRILELRELIAAETDIERMTDLVGAADSIEEAMCNAGYRRDTEAIRPANEARFEARWKLGQLLAKVERRVGRPSENCPGSGQFRAYLTDIGLNKNRANECQRISAIPEAKLRRAFEETAQEGVLNTIDSMFLFARPFWKIKERVRRHRAIRDAAEAVAALEPESFGPFALIYADPPTHFETFTEGSYRGPNQHYPTLSWEEIENFTLYGKRVEQIAHEHAMLFLWCTSSNLHYGLDVTSAWGFDFKASAAWDKGVQGTGLIFRNMHEVLLYGSRGKPPGPVYVPPSVFRYPRGRHSAKPPEIRAEIARMYPDFASPATRLELFARGEVLGWSTYGFEAD